MKTLLLLLISVLLSLSTFSQIPADPSSQIPPSNQNPNYLVSQNKYMAIKDSLLATSNTTVQQTYKAYDWYQNKLDRKQSRLDHRRKLRINRSNRSYSRRNNFGNGFGNNWNNNGFGNNWNNNGFGNNWNNNGWNQNSWGNNFNSFRPSIGYRTGNWWFGF